jgi:hypothetical protein
MLQKNINRLLLSNNTDSLASSTSSLGVLTSDTQSPVVSETSVGTHSLQTLEILTELVVKLVDKKVRILAVDNISLSVEEPAGDLILSGVLDDGNNSLQLFDGELTSSLAEVDIGLLADQIGVTTTNTSDSGKSVHNLDLTIDVGRQQTQNVLEISLFSDHK